MSGFVFSGCTTCIHTNSRYIRYYDYTFTLSCPHYKCPGNIPARGRHTSSVFVEQWPRAGSSCCEQCNRSAIAASRQQPQLLVAREQVSVIEGVSCLQVSRSRQQLGLLPPFIAQLPPPSSSYTSTVGQLFLTRASDGFVELYKLNGSKLRFCGERGPSLLTCSCVSHVGVSLIRRSLGDYYILHAPLILPSSPLLAAV
jgi:hypothetical protein